MTATLCRTCYREEVAPGRVALGLFSCLLCGEKAARKVKHTVVPLHKSHCMVVTDRALLKGLNKYAKD